jgi:hypothetical protein
MRELDSREGYFEVGPTKLVIGGFIWEVKQRERLNKREKISGKGSSNGSWSDRYSNPEFYISFIFELVSIDIKLLDKKINKGKHISSNNNPLEVI